MATQNKITVICQVPGSYYFFKEQLMEAVKNRKNDFLAIVPVNRAVRRLKRELIDQAAGQVMADPPIFTFDRLLLHVYQALPDARHLLSTEVLNALVADILESRRSEFEYLLRGKEPTAGMVQKVSETLSELRRFGFNSAKFFNVSPADFEIHKPKYQDFARLLNFLEERLGLEQIDEPFAQAEAAGRINQELFKKLFPRVERVFVSGYGLFTPPMLQFIKRVGEFAPVWINLAFDQRNAVLFNHTQLALQQLKALGADIEQQKSSSFLAVHFFNRENLPAKKADFKDRIQIVALQQREQEVAYIAGRIRELVKRQNIPLHRIAVTFSHLEKYADLIRRVFKDFGIPFNLSTGFALSASPLIGAFLEVLRIVEQGFPLEETLSFFQNAFLDKENDLNTPLLQKLFARARLRQVNQSALKKLYQRLPDLLSLFEEENHSLPIEAAQQEVQKLEKQLEPFFAFPEDATAMEFRQKYLELLQNLGLLNWYQRENSFLTREQQENNFRAYNRFVKVFERSMWTLRLLYGDAKIKRNRFFNILNSTVQQAVYNLSEWPDYGVQIMPRLEILAMDFEVLFVGGLLDGDFPRSSTKDIFFSDSVRAEIGLMASEELLDQDRFLFYQLLDSPARQIVLTFPQFREEEALVPSSFLADLEEIAEVSRQAPQEDAPVFRNIHRLWAELGFDINFLLGQEHLQAAAHKLALLKALFPNQQVELLRLLERIRRTALRKMGSEFSPFEGNLSTNSRVVQQLNHLFGNRVWSITRLESYAFCPMQFFFRYVLKVESPQPVEEEITPAERGQIVHRILFRFFTELKAKKQQSTPWEFETLLKEIAREELNRLPYHGLFWELEQLYLLGDDRHLGILPAFLQAEQRRMEGDHCGYTPTYFELSFGENHAKDCDAHSVKNPVVLKFEDQAIRLRGRIDRVDVEGSGKAMVIDYKTGFVSSQVTDEVILGRHLQLPLYLLILNHVIKGLEPVFGGLYALRRAQDVKLKPVLSDKNAGLVKTNNKAKLPNKHFLNDEGVPLSFDEALQKGLKAAIEAVKNINKGCFQHTLLVEDDRCRRYCEYRKICQKVPGKLKRIAELKEREAKDTCPN